MKRKHTGLCRDSRHKTWIMATAAAATLALTACGSSTSPSTALLTGHFIDAPVKGLCYSTSPSNQSGITDATGAYRYQAGDTVKFGLPTAPNDCSSPVNLGSAAPKPPADGSNAITFVLSLANGQRVAEVLNTLNLGTVDAMNVSGLSIAPSTATAISDYIQKGPTAGTTNAQALAPIQAKTPAPSGSQYLNSVTSTTDLTSVVNKNLAQSATALPAPTITSSDVVGTLAFISTSNGNSVFAYIPDDKTVNVLYPLKATPRQEGYGLQKNVMRVSKNNNGTVDDEITINFRDEQKWLATDNDLRNKMTVNGVFNLLQPLTLSSVAGKSITLPQWDKCSATSTSYYDATYTFSADGTKLQSKNITGFAYTVSQDAALPGVLKVTNPNDKRVRYVGLDKGQSLGAGATLYWLTSEQGSNTNPIVFGSFNLVNEPTGSPCSAPSFSVAQLVGNWKGACYSTSATTSAFENITMSQASNLVANLTGVKSTYNAPNCAGTATVGMSMVGTLTLDGSGITTNINGKAFTRTVVNFTAPSAKTEKNILALSADGRIIYMGSKAGALDADGYPVTASSGDTLTKQ